MAKQPGDHGVPLPFLTPARAASGPWRTIGVGQSFAVHLLGLLILSFGLVVLLPSDATELKDEASAEPAATLLFLFVFFFGIQAGYLAAALLTACLGAGYEPWGAGYRRTLSRWYQLTPWHALLIVALVGVMLLIDDLERDYVFYYYSRGMRQVLEIERARFLIDTGRYLSTAVFGAVMLWLTLKTLAVHDQTTWHPACRWPAVCERCGYALVGLEDDQGCPECGKPVRESKHPSRDVIRGSYWAITRAALTRPSELGQRMLTRRPTRRATRQLTLAMLLTVLAGPACVVMADISDRMMGWGSSSSLLSLVERYVFGGLLLGVGMAWFGAMFCLGAGSLHAAFAGLLAKRGELSSCCQACCLSAGLIPIWAIVGTGSLIGTWWIEEILYSRGHFDLADLARLGFFISQGIILMAYFLLVGRIARPARYANI